MAKIIVLGGGFGGIAAAIRARALGHDVQLIEKNEEIGGRARVFQCNGFRHDAGPTVITAPFLFDELFQCLGERREDFIAFQPLSIGYRFIFDDKSQFDYATCPQQLAEEIAKISPVDCENYQTLLATSQTIYQLGFEQLAFQPFHRFFTMLAQVPDMLKLKSYRSVWQLVCEHLAHEKLRRAFSIQPLLVGGNPFDTTSIYNLIHFLERKHGIHFAMGGTGALVAALRDLMVKHGIEIITNTCARKMTVKDGNITGVVTVQGKTFACDHLISNLDPTFLYKNLLADHGNLHARFRQRFAKQSMGLYVLFFGTRKQFVDIQHHTILMGERFESLLDDIFHRQVISEDISIYLHRPTATDPSFAPDGCDSYYALVPVPNLEGGQDWQEEGEIMKQRVLNRLQQQCMPDLIDVLDHAFFMTPEDFQQDYLSVSGAGFSIAPLLRQSAWFRYHNKGEGIQNLSLVGAGTHPGAGLPGVLSSAKVVESLLIEQYGMEAK